MIHVFNFECDKCGDTTESESDQDSLGICRYCEGRYLKTGETYDQEFVDQEKYDRQQDEEYERRHRYDC